MSSRANATSKESTAGQRSHDSFGGIDAAIGGAINDLQQVSGGRYSARAREDPAVAVEYEQRWDAQDVMVSRDLEVVPSVDRHPAKVGTRLRDLGEDPLHRPAWSTGWGSEQKGSHAAGRPVEPDRGELLRGEAPVACGDLLRAGGPPAPPLSGSGWLGDPSIAHPPPRSHDKHRHEDRDDDEQTQ